MHPSTLEHLPKEVEPSTQLLPHVTTGAASKQRRLLLGAEHTTSRSLDGQTHAHHAPSVKLLLVLEVLHHLLDEREGDLIALHPRAVVRGVYVCNGNAEVCTHDCYIIITTSVKQECRCFIGLVPFSCI